LVAAVEELDEVVDGGGCQVGRLGVVDDLRGEPRGNHEGMVGSAVRARSWHLEFREMVLKCAVYNLRRTVRYP